ncbi:MAG: hypothetical protein Kow0090_20470 [Myxococcota bacterium]
MRCPGEIYTPSPREYTGREIEMEYPSGYEVRSVRQNGTIRWNGEIFLSEVLIGERVGLRQVSENEWEVYFGDIMLAMLDDKERKIRKPSFGGAPKGRS